MCDILEVRDKPEARSQHSEMHHAVIDVVNAVTFLTDLREWRGLLDCFNGQVEVDYTSLDPDASGQMKATELVDKWRRVVGSFTATQHLVTNHLVHVEGDVATCRAHLHAIHHLADDDAGDGFWECGGHYHFKLLLVSGGWRVSEIQFNLLWERGDRGLLERAAANGAESAESAAG